MKKLIYTLPLLLALGACSNEDALPGGQEDIVTPDYETYYLTMDMALPQGTRGENDLAGTDKEEEISSLDIYLLDTNNQVKWSKTNISKVTSFTDANTEGFTLTDGTGTTDQTIDKQYSVRIKLADSDFSGDNGLEKLKNNSSLKLFVVCNATSGTDYNAITATNSPLKVQFTTTGVGKIHGAFSTGSDQGKALPMANAQDCSVTVFNNNTEVKQLFTYNADANGMVLNLNATVSVERAAARLDIKDAGADGRKYAIGTGNDFKLELYSLNVKNINPNSYLALNSVADQSGVATGDYALYKRTGDYWVADPTWTGSYTKGAVTDAGATETPIATIVTQSDGSKYTPTTGGTYYPFWYVTENNYTSTTEMKTDIQGDSPKATYVEFKFKVTKTDGTVIPQNGEGAPNGIVVADNKMSITLTDGSYQENIAWDATAQAYCLTYKGFITHGTYHGTAENYNVMENGVVRNYVYQLAIGTISNLPDPDGTRPYYLDLTINVLNWGTRQFTFNW